MAVLKRKRRTPIHFAGAPPARELDSTHTAGFWPSVGRAQANEGDERHDNGLHKGQEKQEARAADYRAWDHEHDRIVPGKHYPRGHYEHVKEVFVARSIDYRTRNVVLYDRSNWVVASYDLNRCRDWQWDRDQVYVYDDDHHPGWYLLFNPARPVRPRGVFRHPVAQAESRLQIGMRSKGTMN